MELKEGMYVRHEHYGIGKVTKVCKCEECKARGFYEPFIEFADDCDNVTTYNYMQEYEGKASHNIIDLIEIGDYVNGHIVEDLDDLGYITLDDDTIKYDDIKSIVTKEQFSAMEYKLGDE